MGRWVFTTWGIGKREQNRFREVVFKMCMSKWSNIRELTEF